MNSLIFYSVHYRIQTQFLKEQRLCLKENKIKSEVHESDTLRQNYRPIKISEDRIIERFNAVLIRCLQQKEISPKIAIINLIQGFTC